MNCYKLLLIVVPGCLVKYVNFNILANVFKFMNCDFVSSKNFPEIVTKSSCFFFLILHSCSYPNTTLLQKCSIFVLGMLWRNQSIWITSEKSTKAELNLWLENSAVSFIALES